jgi:hypothetical protein
MNDPIWVYGFSMMHLVYPFVVVGLIFPGWYNFIVRVEKQEKGDYPVAPLEVFDQTASDSLPTYASTMAGVDPDDQQKPTHSKEERHVEMK